MLYSHRDIILFLNVANISNIKILNIISEGNLDKLIDLQYKNIQYLSFLNEAEKYKIEKMYLKFDIEKYYQKLDYLEIKFSTILDSNYPNRLKNIYNAPAILYYKGKGFNKSDNTIAIVGTRKANPYGIWMTKNIINGLKGYDITTVSGMALGIDAICHEESIKNDIKTVGVLASSLEIRYPKSNRYLYDKMEENLLISEFPLGTNPIKRNFVFRNRIISGISLGTVVISAAEKSGSLITANFALEQNREVFAVPGNVNEIYSKGTNELIKKGARAVTSHDDIIETLSLVKEIDKVSNYLPYNFDKKEYMTLINLLQESPLTIDELKFKTKFNYDELYLHLTKLEIQGIITKIRDKYIIE